MTQKELEAAVRLALIGLLREQGVTLPVLAAFEPSKQGRVDDGVYFFPVGTGQHGWQSRKYLDHAHGLVAKETQIDAPMYQFQAFVMDDVRNDAQLLASDVVALVRGLIQSMRFLQRMSAVGVGVQRPSEILQPSFLNERDDFEFNPNFTVIFTHKRSITQETPHVTRVQPSIHRL
ncbi:phage gateway protein [Bordetella avium]|uniref:Phage protein n=1 Tax=Bordetella avium (strain 197N) TaxID=360910 RepID=Q2L2V8_BORA1|nr:hypothetical protein [Bordetella avium]RIQ51172.1 hypothetical protein D0844_13795 [Bordetella avium]CAJ48931.1 putative phage protein [Bordetella avium 197N]